MKKKMPSEGLRLGRDSGSILCDTLKKVAFSDSLGGGNFNSYNRNALALYTHCIAANVR